MKTEATHAAMADWPGRERDPFLLAWRSHANWPMGMVSPPRSVRRAMARRGEAPWAHVPSNHPLRVQRQHRRG